MFSGWLTAAVFLPAATALVLVFMPRRDSWIRWTAIGATVVELGLTIGIFVAAISIPLGVDARAKSLGVTWLTRTSVHCAESSTAISSV